MAEHASPSLGNAQIPCVEMLNFESIKQILPFSLKSKPLPEPAHIARKQHRVRIVMSAAFVDVYL